jgi:hypothetical protein
VGGAAGALLAFAACAASDLASDAPRTGGPDASASSDSATHDSGDPAPPLLEADIVLLVHAASLPAFRICLEHAGKDLPQPSDELLAAAVAR